MSLLFHNKIYASDSSAKDCRRCFLRILFLAESPDRNNIGPVPFFIVPLVDGTGSFAVFNLVLAFLAFDFLTLQNKTRVLMSEFEWPIDI